MFDDDDDVDATDPSENGVEEGHEADEEYKQDFEQENEPEDKRDDDKENLGIGEETRGIIVWSDHDLLSERRVSNFLTIWV
jgi:hypothetical protein